MNAENQPYVLAEDNQRPVVSKLEDHAVVRTPSPLAVAVAIPGQLDDRRFIQEQLFVIHTSIFLTFSLVLFFNKPSKIHI